MDQFLSKLLDKYGLARMVIAVIIGVIVLWFLAHLNSAPGGNVSVLWGLVHYTKNKPEAVLNPPSQKKEHSTASELLSSLKDDITLTHGITQETYVTTLKSIRAERHLRPLEALESGRSVTETARGTYFFTPFIYLNTSSVRMSARLNEIKVNRFKEGNYCFEIHYLKTGAPIIMALTYESDAIRLVSPNHEIRKISIAADPWEKMTSLLSLPMDYIITANDRTIDLSETEKLFILDLEIE